VYISFFVCQFIAALLLFKYTTTMKKLLVLAFIISIAFATKAQIIISQYYEGTGTNKWIELTNLGTSAVNTASPQLSLGLWSATGSTGNIAFTGAATATVNLSVTIPAKGSVLIGNTLNGTEISYLTAASAALTSNTVINFNGNDGIALLNSAGTVIDRFGTGINATDISYVRSTSVTAPSATFTSSQWATATIATVNAAGTTNANRLGFHIPTTPLCVTPSAVTALSFTSTTNSTNGSFTAATGTNNYLVIQSTNSTLSASPINGTTYTTGNSFGGGTILSYGNSTSFSGTSLTAATTYNYFIYTATTGCTGAPFYSTALIGSKATASNSTGAGAYYDAAVGLSCQALKTSLKNIISTGFNNLSYTPGIWNIYYYSDKRLNDAGTATIVWDMYSDNPTGAEPYTYTLGTNQCGSYTAEGGCYNREHSTPQSWFNSLSPMVSDAHHIFATDGKVNATRSNYPYGEVSSATSTSLNGSKLGTGTTNFGYTGIVFEPRNEYKGDFARACLYMATRYEDEIISQNWSALGTANAVFLSTTDQANATTRRLQIYDAWYLQLLIKWHNQDPVSQKEIDRNNAIYNQQVANNSAGTLVKQNNRNPFVDHPEYVVAIWGTGNGVACGVARTAVTIDVKPTYEIFPNPATSIINVTVDKNVQQLQVTDVYGRVFITKKVALNSNTVPLQIDGLQKGNYIVKIITAAQVTMQNFVKQ
jgi:endonuclease I